MLLQNEQRQVVTQRIDPKIILANNILQLSTVELMQSIEAEILENPALETVDEAGCDGNCLDPSTCPYCSAHRNSQSEENSPAYEVEMIDFSGDYEPLPGVAYDQDEEYDFVGNLEAEMTLKEHLLSALRTVVPAEDFRIGEYIINSLNDRGWLDGTVETIAMDLEVDPADVERVLTAVQSLEPPGIGARSLQECLLIQLCYIRDFGVGVTPSILRKNALAEQMMRHHFDLVSTNRYAKLSRAVGIPTDDVKEVLDYIRTRLNPFPANQFRPPWNYRPANVRAAVRPDVIIRRSEFGYDIDVVGVDTYGLSINPTYRAIYAEIKSGKGSHSDEQRKHVMEHVERAEQFMRSLHQRRQTLRQITRCVIECQSGFLETGSRQFLRALTRTQVARMLSVHESTVSRATANKYIQLPNQEVVSYNIFFNASLSVKDAIESLISNENPSQPLSDAQIVKLLEDKGIHVARRTVVKYRESQKILSSTRRRR